MPAFAAAQPAPEIFDPRELGRDIEGPKTQVLVLGSSHLSAAPDSFDRKNLTLVLEKLSAFAPAVVAIEFLSGESIDALERYEAVYPDVANTYGKTVRTAREASGPALGLTHLQAEMQARQMLASLPARPSASDRRKLAATLAAAGDFSSATVQWLQLSEKERKAADGVSDALLPLLDRWSNSRNEALSVGAALAARLKLNRVYAVDDHSADDIVIRLQAPLEAHLSNDPELKTMVDGLKALGVMDMHERMTSPQAVLDAYRHLNSPTVWRGDAALQWGYFLRSKAPGLLGRQRLAEWEARNLRMAAHLREAFAHHPGERVLFVVGSAHKAYIEAYLDRMHDVEIVDALAVLK